MDQKGKVTRLPYLLLWVRVLLLIRSITSTTWGPRGMAAGETSAPSGSGDAPADRAFAAALLGGLAYALVAEDVHPLLPFVTPETFAISVIVAVAFAELLKNVVYEPIILGGSVKLHPLVVVIGVIGGAILFGPAGMFLAIPTITVVKALVASGARHLKAYGLV
jgi:hypothetical protein